LEDNFYFVMEQSCGQRTFLLQSLALSRIQDYGVNREQYIVNFDHTICVMTRTEFGSMESTQFQPSREFHETSLPQQLRPNY
jgi:hypothetical protein